MKKKSLKESKAKNAIELLKEDHETVKKLFDRFEKTRSSEEKAA